MYAAKNRPMFTWPHASTKRVQLALELGVYLQTCTNLDDSVVANVIGAVFPILDWNLLATMDERGVYRPKNIYDLEDTEEDDVWDITLEQNPWQIAAGFQYLVVKLEAAGGKGDGVLEVISCSMDEGEGINTACYVVEREGCPRQQILRRCLDNGESWRQVAEKFQVDIDLLSTGSTTNPTFRFSNQRTAWTPGGLETEALDRLFMKIGQQVQVDTRDEMKDCSREMMQSGTNQNRGFATCFEVINKGRGGGNI